MILLCEDLGLPGSSLDLDAVEGWIATQAIGAPVLRVAGPCERPARWLDQGVRNARGLVLGVCALNSDRHELDAQARKLGLDPFGIEVVALRGHPPPGHPPSVGTDRARLLLAAAAAKVQAYQGSRPESAKPILRWGPDVSRRALFTLPPMRYEAIPSIREAACAAGEGCRVCAKTCPHGALAASTDGRMVLSPAPCTGCGACVPACPRTAIDFPGSSLAQLEAQVAALLGPAPGALDARGVLFVCPRSAQDLDELGRRGHSYPPGWLPVAIPCMGMLTPAWVLQCLDQGAAAVGLLPCPKEACRFGRRDAVAGAVDYCRQLLRALGGSPDAVRSLDGGDPEALARALAVLPAAELGGAAGRPRAAPRFAPGDTARAVLGLARRHGAPADVSLAHPGSPFGVVEVQHGCTGCGACVSACPTPALALEREGDLVSLCFDARLCIGCGECAPVCPERVVRVEKVTELRRLAEGRRVLHRDREIRCLKCGAAVAPRAMLERIRGLLGTDPALSAVTRYCADCRGTLL
jgi:ferredoxin